MLLGYGEDALTLWALTKGLPLFLQQLGDGTSPPETTVFFRPSFGRKAPNPRGKKSVFGEFDGIVCSLEANYLVEGKWNKSSELVESEITLSPVQIRRHEIMHWYCENWQQQDQGDWRSFRDMNKRDFEEVFSGYTIPTDGTVLARNLEYVLATMKRKDLPLQDVLLFSSIDAMATPSVVQQNDLRFRLVTFRVRPVGGDGFIAIG